MTKYKRNKGLQKICGCARKDWTTCAHSWHFSYQRKGKHYRFSLDGYAKEHGLSPIDSKSAAEDLQADLKKAIRAGTFGRPKPKKDLTVRQLADEYLDRYVKVHKAARANVFKATLNVILRVEIPHPTGGVRPLGDWPAAEVVSDTLERFREIKLVSGTGIPGTNRLLSSLRALWAWGLGKDHVTSTPFKRHGEVVVRLPKEQARTRRLDDGEEAKIVAAAGPHLQALVIAAVDTGMRRGEILSLQWKQVEGMIVEKNTVTWAAKAKIFLPKEKTKTKQDRRIPISTRLRGILDMRRFDPRGEPHPLDSYVFGSEIGTKLAGFKRAWITAVLKAHGQPPTYTGDSTANFSPASRAAFRDINLHFHDLRREAGSRWMDGGVPIATIQRWLGHTNVSQTSTYLAGTETSEHDQMARYEATVIARNSLVTVSRKPGKAGPRKAAQRNGKPRKTGVDRETTIN